MGRGGGRTGGSHHSSSTHHHSTTHHHNTSSTHGNGTYVASPVAILVFGIIALAAGLSISLALLEEESTRVCEMAGIFRGEQDTCYPVNSSEDEKVEVKCDYFDQGFAKLYKVNNPSLSTTTRKYKYISYNLTIERDDGRYQNNYFQLTTGLGFSINMSMRCFLGDYPLGKCDDVQLYWATHEEYSNRSGMYPLSFDVWNPVVTMSGNKSDSYYIVFKTTRYGRVTILSDIEITRTIFDMSSFSAVDCSDDKCVVSANEDDMLLVDYVVPSSEITTDSSEFGPEQISVYAYTKSLKTDSFLFLYMFGGFGLLFIVISLICFGCKCHEMKKARSNEAEMENAEGKVTQETTEGVSADPSSTPSDCPSEPHYEPGEDPTYDTPY